MQTEADNFQIVELPAELPPPKRLAYNYASAAFALDISKRTLRREIDRGNITPLEGYCLIAEEELRRWIQERGQRRQKYILASSPPNVQPFRRRRARRINPPLAETPTETAAAPG